MKFQVSVSNVYGVIAGDRDGRCIEVSRLPDLVPIKGLDAVCLSYDCHKNMIKQE
jgi:hypothetical protein